MIRLARSACRVNKASPRSSHCLVLSFLDPDGLPVLYLLPFGAGMKFYEVCFTFSSSHALAGSYTRF